MDFNESAFMEYLQAHFRGFENPFLRDLVSNIIEHGLEQHNAALDQFVFFMLDTLPDEFEFGEIAQFAHDDKLTKRGKAEKNSYINEHKHD